MIGLNGRIEAYSDYSGITDSDINVTFPERDVFLGQTVIQYGEREIATLAKAKIDGVAKKQYSAAMNIAIAQNKLFFFGNINGAGAFINHVFGILNDPQLNPATPATNGTSGNPLWSVKAANVATGANDIAQDVIVTAMTQMQAQMGANVDNNMKFKLIVPSGAVSYMNAVNSFGLNATKIIQDTLPNLTIVSAPEYNTVGSFQLIGPSPQGGDMVADLFTYKVRGHTLIPAMSAKKQKWSFGSSGCAIFQYAPIVTISGIM
jgi:hypothetical protein